ncbi:MAG: hypothetical protein ACYSUV_01035 [Planctomycetota bacterium]
MRRVTSSLDVARFFAPLRMTTTLCIGIFVRLEPPETKDSADAFGKSDAEALGACLEVGALQIGLAGLGR